MRRFVFLSLGVGILLGLVFGTSHAQKREGGKEAKAPVPVAVRLPGSLDPFYPPQADRPLYLIRMFELGGLFSGLVGDLVENEMQGARDVFKKFKTQYLQVAAMVPEWRKGYPLRPVEELEAALKLGNREKAMAAHGKLGKACHDCHVKYMPLVHRKYHWGDFSAIKVKDPLSQEEVPFARLKQYLDANFAGIRLSSERGQREKGQKQIQGFKARFQALKMTCGRCHSGEKSYADQSVQGLIQQLEQAFETSSVDPQRVAELTQKIGMESCFRCHLVHVPAAFAHTKDPMGKGPRK